MMDEARAGERLLKVGEVAYLTGLSVKTLHHYEERGLAKPVGRTETGYRLYGEEEVARLKFIKRAKLLGLTLEEIRELVSLAAGCNGGEIMPRLEEVLEEKLEETERKMGELAAFKESLLYYSERLAEADPKESCDLETSFCGCLEAATGEGSAAGSEDAKEEKVAV